ncbi:MAG: hypothetical protein P1V36_01140 [Planctomycetota bacterium]|nr:hypothetical protein [Planctomycetota bacterium]
MLRRHAVSLIVLIVLGAAWLAAAPVASADTANGTALDEASSRPLLPSEVAPVRWRTTPRHQRL